LTLLDKGDGIKAARIFREYEESNLFGFCEIFRVFSEIIERCRPESDIQVSKTHSIDILREYFLFRVDVFDTESIDRLEEFMLEISLLIDPESVANELGRYRRSSLDYSS
jgi:hypothetical protein